MKRHLFQEMVEVQNKFDQSRGWFWGDDPERESEYISYGIIALSGELGELANAFTKWLRNGGRGEIPVHLANMLSEEMVDILISLIKMAACLELDLEYLFFEKMEKNAKRFKESVGM